MNVCRVISADSKNKKYEVSFKVRFVQGFSQGANKKRSLILQGWESFFQIHAWTSPTCYYAPIMLGISGGAVSLFTLRTKQRHVRHYSNIFVTDLLGAWNDWTFVFDTSPEPKITVFLNDQRIFSNIKFYDGGMKGEKKTTTTKEALEWATINNAIALGIDNKIGSLTPGKKADLILVDSESLNMVATHNPEQATVLHANESDIRFVLIDGKIVKKNGKLFLSDEKLKRWKEELKESRKNLMQRSGFNS